MVLKLVVAISAALVLVGVALASARVNPVLRVGANHFVSGSHFKAHELVRVVFTTDVRQVRLVRTTGTGSFAAQLPAPVDSCATLLIRATGSAGDGALIRLPQGLCPPPSANELPPQTGGLPPGADGPPTINKG
jgi:hypothetical protein